MSKARVAWKAGIGCAILLAFSSTALGQTATISGDMTDPAGALVPNATVKLKTAGAGTRSATSGTNGRYSFSNVPIGTYTLEASAPNLATPQPLEVAIRPGTQIINLRLEILQVTEQVQVQDDGGKIGTEAANNANSLVISGHQLDALSDDPEDLQSDLQALAGPSAGPSGASIYIDGFSNGELPPKSSIREVRINQNPFSPEYDKIGYGRIDILTKPGSDKFHGEIGYNFANQFWNSRNPYASRKAPLLLDEWENNVSGPINKRTSFTLDLEYHAVNNGSVINGEMLNPDTLAVTPFNSIVTTPQRRLRVDPRIDYQLSENNTLSLRYTFTRSDIHDAGIGAFNLESQGYRDQNAYDTIQLVDTQILGTAVNETRFEWFRWKNIKTANELNPELKVLASFIGGGSQFGASSDTQNNFEAQNYTSWIRGAHTLRFGVRLRGATEDSFSPLNFNGTYTFAGGVGPELGPDNLPIAGTAVALASIERYRRTLLFDQMGYTPAEVRALGGGASQFTLSAGLPKTSEGQVDAGLFAGDDWRLKPNFLLSYGLRYETQTNIYGRGDWAPRLSFAWQPKALKKTVIRGGYGIFYDRFPLADVLLAQRYNGVVQQQYVVNNPTFYPLIPTASTVATLSQGQIIEKLSPTLRAPYVMQGALVLERQLTSNTTVAASYINSHGMHLLRTDIFNAPLPGTYNPTEPGSGVYPLGNSNPIFQMSSDGIYNQNQLIVNVNARLNSQVNLFGYYVYNHAMSNTDGLTTSPANPYSSAGEYSNAVTDIRHRLLIGGSINTRWNVRLSPFITVQSGAPFDVTVGHDLYGTTLFNGRPGIATDPMRAGVIETSYGLLDPNPLPEEKLLPRNYGWGPAIVAVNVRLAKTFGFGSRSAAAAKGSSPPASPGAASKIPAGKELRSLLSPPSGSSRYNLTVGISARNVLNHLNPGPIIGDISSPLFGRSNLIYGTPNGEGFLETANNRRLEVQIQFKF